MPGVKIGGTTIGWIGPANVEPNVPTWRVAGVIPDAIAQTKQGWSRRCGSMAVMTVVTVVTVVRNAWERRRAASTRNESPTRLRMGGIGMVRLGDRGSHSTDILSNAANYGSSRRLLV